MSVIDTLIFDRTESDIIQDTDKAYIDYKDLNRIEEAVKYLSDILNNHKYLNTVNVKTDWKISDLRKEQECQRIKQNYNILKNAYDYKFDVPNFNWESIEEANNIEKILRDIYWIIKNMEKVFVYTGVAGTGQNRIWQQRFRRYGRSLRQWLELTQVYWSDFSETQTWEDIIYD